MEFYKSIAILGSLLFVAGCGSVKKEHPYRPSGKSKKVVKAEKRVANRQRQINFLRERYNLCTHRRALRSARFEYNKIVNREKRFGNILSKEKNNYKNMILEISKRTKKEQAAFERKYNRWLFCTPKEMRHLNL